MNLKEIFDLIRKHIDEAVQNGDIMELVDEALKVAMKEICERRGF